MLIKLKRLIVVLSILSMSISTTGCNTSISNNEKSKKADDQAEEQKDKQEAKKTVEEVKSLDGDSKANSNKGKEDK